MRGENLFLGYLNRPDTTAEATDGHWFRTGDLAPHKRLRTIQFVGDLPRNELGKVQKKRLTAS